MNISYLKNKTQKNQTPSFEAVNCIDKEQQKA